MENLFLHYMEQHAIRKSESKSRELGPVITISREYGCYGSEIGDLLEKKLNQKKQPNNTSSCWVFVSHQVLCDAAKTLDVEPSEITHIFGAEEKSILGDLVSIFSSDKYISDTQIKRTIAQVVRSYAEQGNAIIVGRAGCIIAKHIKKSLHVKLTAPFNWRVNTIKKRFGISQVDAIDKVKETDKRRETFMEFFRGNKPDSELFDLVLNRSTLSTEEIADQIVFAAQKRGLF